ncbi:hypothetical protein ABK040_012258 [Willaertia magna]
MSKLNFYKERVNSTRFSSLYLDFDEYIYEITDSNFTYLRIDPSDKELPPRGHLVICSNSIVFCPEEFSLPVFKISFKEITSIKTSSNDKGLSAKTKGIEVKCNFTHVLRNKEEIHPFIVNGQINTIIIAVKKEEHSRIMDKLNQILSITKVQNETQRV